MPSALTNCLVAQPTKWRYNPLTFSAPHDRVNQDTHESIFGNLFLSEPLSDYSSCTNPRPIVMKFCTRTARMFRSITNLFVTPRSENKERIRQSETYRSTWLSLLCLCYWPGWPNVFSCKHSAAFRHLVTAGGNGGQGASLGMIVPHWGSQAELKTSVQKE